MKKLIFTTFLLITLSANSFSQWYYKKYFASDINALTREQLDESLHNTKTYLAASGIVAVVGGLLVVTGIYLPYQESEDPTFWEQLLGPKGMNTLSIATGVILLAGGTIATFIYLGRFGMIKSTIRKNFPETGSLNFSPNIMFNNYTRTYSAGFSLSLRF
jgi:hypothetical protein